MVTLRIRHMETQNISIFRTLFKELGTFCDLKPYPEWRTRKCRLKKDRVSRWFADRRMRFPIRVRYACASFEVRFETERKSQKSAGEPQVSKFESATLQNTNLSQLLKLYTHTGFPFPAAPSLYLYLFRSPLISSTITITLFSICAEEIHSRFAVVGFVFVFRTP